MIRAVIRQSDIAKARAAARWPHLINAGIDIPDPPVFLIKQFGNARPHRSGDTSAADTAVHRGSAGAIRSPIVTGIVGTRAIGNVWDVALAVRRSAGGLKRWLGEDGTLAAARSSRRIVPHALGHRA
jgi:hypothetical protein